MGKPKKVLFTSHTANFHKFNRPFMRMLKEQGYTVHYASAGEEKVHDADKHFDVPFERSPFKPGNIKAYFKLKKIIDREKYDLIHTHTPMGSVVTRLAARAVRKKGTRVIYTAHGFHFFKGAPLLNWIVYYPIEKFMARHTDTLIAINNEDYERAKAKFKTDVEYVPGVGVDLRKYKPVLGKEKESLRRKNGFNKDDVLLVCAAELNENKNQIFLIDAMPEILKLQPKTKLLLCGEGHLMSSYKKRIQALNLDDFVFLLGYRSDMAKLFQMVDICVSSSRREGLGLNLIEASASGLGVVASRNRGHLDVAKVSKGQTILYSLDDAFEYVNAVSRSLNNLESTNFPKNNINSVDHFSLDAVGEMMKLIYQRVV